MAVDLDRLESRARQAYEKGRLRYALGASVPVLALAVLVQWIGPRPEVVLTLVVALFATEALFLWRGQQLGRGAMAGLMGGAIPLAFGLCTQVYAHVCGSMLAGAGCTAVCACGGLVGGLVIAAVARRQPSPAVFAGAAATTAALLGAIGCACAGLAGVVGLMIGIAVPVAAVRIHAATART